MEKILALYDSDYSYALRFMEFLNHNKEADFKILTFTKKESLEEFLLSHPIELLLIGEDNPIEELQGQNIKYLYQLSETPNKVVEDGFTRVCKYQSAKSLINEIMSDYTDREIKTKGIPASKQLSIISIFSPITSVEKISFAWSLSSILSEQNKVLFVLLELFPTPIVSTFNINSQNLTDFIYYLKESPVTAKIKMQTGSSGRLAYLAGILHGADILSLNREDIQKWISELRANSDFLTVVFLIGCYSEAMIELMKLSDTVLVPLLENPYEAGVVREWKRQMNQFGVNTEEGKYQFISLQEQNGRVQLPLSMQELMNNTAWNDARKYLNC